MRNDDLLSIADIDTMTGDDIAYWLNNPFVPRGYILGKIRFWVTKSVAASIARAAAEWSQRANEGLSGSVLAAKAEAWDEGCTAGADYEGRRVSEYPYDWPDDVPRNPYRDQP